MKRIALCPNVMRDGDFSCTLRAKAMLEAAGCQVVISPICGDGGAAPFETLPLDEALEGADLLITLGGDGTILRIVPLIVGHAVPLIGVNLGHKGFLAELDEDSLSLLLRAAEGRFELVPRMMLDVELWRDGAMVFADTGLNEAVISGVVQNIRLTALGDGIPILDFSGDGIIVSSPTGSTAYSMSAGGPLVEPGAETIILTPICAHMLAARSFVLTPEREITVVPSDLEPDKRCVVSVDGRGMTELRSGDRVVVRRSANKLFVADLGTKSFYETAFEKLGGRT